jgi:hypothetical protein
MADAPGTLAHSLLCTALDEADPEPSSIVALLDSIPGALERANQGLREINSGKGIPLDDLDDEDAAEVKK